MTRTNDHYNGAGWCCWHPGQSSSESTPSNTHDMSIKANLNTKSHQCTVAGSVGIYWFFCSLIPVYNKFFFKKTLYPFPIATAGIQLAVVAVLLAVWNMVQHQQQQVTETRCRRQRQQEQTYFYQDEEQEQQQPDDNAEDLPPRSWILGPHLLYKLKWCLPIGAIFGAKYAVTNWGLHLVPAPTHLLLQSTDLVWTVLSAWLINQERVRPLEMVCLLGCIIGSFVLSWNHITRQHHEEEAAHAADPDSADTPTLSTKDMLKAPLFAIGINLLSPMLLGLCLSTLRLACTELMRPDNRLNGTVSSVELTSIKLFMSSAVATVLAMILEPEWWGAFWDLERATRDGVLCGAVLIACFQVNCTFLTNLTNTVSVGLVGQVKIIPQWIVATIFATEISKDFHLQTQNVVGALLICVSAAAFCWSNIHSNKHENDVAAALAADADSAVATDDDSSNETDVEKHAHNDEDAETMPLLMKRQTSTVSSEYLSIR